MRWPLAPRRVLVVTILVVTAVVLVSWVMRQLSLVSVGLAANEESQFLLQKSLTELKELARANPARSEEYRRRFEETQSLLNHLEIMALSRRELARRFELILLGLVTAIIGAAVAVHIIEQRRTERRMARLSEALKTLSRGDGVVSVGDGGGDIIGTFARMIEETSLQIGRERRRMHYLEHLSSWQEAARRHAHEIRTPLTTARMEITSLMRSMASRLPEAADELQRREQSIIEELERLRAFTSNFVAFASLPSPALQRVDLGRLTHDFIELFTPNWPRLKLRAGCVAPDVCVMADAAMVRQVLVNLCNNSELAIGEREHGVVVFSVQAHDDLALLEIADDGPGLPESVRRRLFEPYTTTRRIGEGLGLGLAISKKILLDHGGDLELVEDAPGATFQLTFPRVE